MSNKLVVIGAGGGGTSVVGKAIKGLEGMGDGFSTIEYHFIDTSKNNYDMIDPIGDFYKVEKLASNDKNIINGAGGTRSIEMIKEINANVPIFLDKIKLTKKETNTFVCLVFSASGGSGSNIGILLAEYLMDKNIPTFALVIGDSGDALKLRNTQAVLATLNKKATDKGKCLITYYVNNAEMDASQTKGESIANDRFKNVMGIMSLFLSGDNESLDSTDMANFINQQDYKGIKTPAGLYSLSVHTGNGEIKLPNYCIPTVARTLTAPGKDVEFGLNVLHHKIGTVVSENALALFGEKSFPLHIVASSGLLKEEISKLSELNSASAKLQDELKATMIEAPTHAAEDDETGMFL